MGRTRDDSAAGRGDDGVVGVYLTFPDAATAEATGASLVEAGLAACVNVFPAAGGAVAYLDWVRGATAAGS